MVIGYFIYRRGGYKILEFCIVVSSCYPPPLAQTSLFLRLCSIFRYRLAFHLLYAQKKVIRSNGEQDRKIESIYPRIERNGLMFRTFIPLVIRICSVDFNEFTTGDRNIRILTL